MSSGQTWCQPAAMVCATSSLFRLPLKLSGQTTTVRALRPAELCGTSVVWSMAMRFTIVAVDPCGVDRSKPQPADPCQRSSTIRIFLCDDMGNNGRTQPKTQRLLEYVRPRRTTQKHRVTSHTGASPTLVSCLGHHYRSDLHPCCCCCHEATWRRPFAADRDTT